MKPARCITAMVWMLARPLPGAMVPVVTIVAIMTIEPMMAIVPVVAVVRLLDEAHLAAMVTGIAHRHGSGLRGESAEAERDCAGKARDQCVTWHSASFLCRPTTRRAAGLLKGVAVED